MKRVTEKIYDTEIAPLLKQAGEICVANSIPFLAVVEYAPGMIGRTAFQSKDECIEMVMVRHCAKTAPNIDGYVIGFMKWAKEHNVSIGASMVLKRMAEATP